MVVNYASQVNSILGNLSELSAMRERQNQEEAQYNLDQAYNKNINRIEAEYQMKIKADEAAQRSTESTEEARARAVDEANYQKSISDFNLAKDNEIIAEKQFKTNKALRLSQAILNTAAGVTAVYANSKDPSLITTTIQAGLVAAAGAVQIATINAEKYRKNNLGPMPQKPVTYTGPNSGSESGNGNGLNQQGVEFNTEQLLTGGRQATDGNLKVYVLESDITNAVNRVRVIQANNTY